VLTAYICDEFGLLDRRGAPARKMAKLNGNWEFVSFVNGLGESHPATNQAD